MLEPLTDDVEAVKSSAGRSPQGVRRCLAWAAAAVGGARLSADHRPRNEVSVKA
jgi:hypothetical protein